MQYTYGRKGLTSMTRSELINYLQILLKLYDDTDDYRVKEIQASKLLEKARSAKQSEAVLKEVGASDVVGNSIGGVLSGIIAFVVSYIGVFVLQIISEWIIGISFTPVYKSSFIAAIVIAVLFGISISFLATDSLKNQNQKAYENAVEQNRQAAILKENLEKYEREYSEISAQYIQRKNSLDALMKKADLHKDYCNHWTIKGLIDILEHGRADTLKEAINLYEEEERQFKKDQEEYKERLRQRQMEERKLQELRNIRNENARAANAAEEASRHAEEAAFWGEVNAYLLDKKLK